MTFKFFCLLMRWLVQAATKAGKAIRDFLSRRWLACCDARCGAVRCSASACACARVVWFCFCAAIFFCGLCLIASTKQILSISINELNFEDVTDDFTMNTNTLSLSYLMSPNPSGKLAPGPPGARPRSPHASWRRRAPAPAPALRLHRSNSNIRRAMGECAMSGGRTGPRARR